MNQISWRLQPDLRLHHFAGHRHVATRELGIPGANLGCTAGNVCGRRHQLRTHFDSVDGGYWSLGDRGYSPFQGGTNVFSVSDSLDHGSRQARHQDRRSHSRQPDERDDRGFPGWILDLHRRLGRRAAADFLLGLADLAIHDQTFNGTITGRRWKMYRPYVQDDWRVSKNLTVNLGLAWALITPITEVAQSPGRISIRHRSIPDCRAGRRVREAGIQYGQDRSGAAHRFGLEAVGQRQTTVVRGGYAIFHDSSWNQGAQGLVAEPARITPSRTLLRLAAAAPFATARLRHDVRT